MRVVGTNKKILVKFRTNWAINIQNKKKLRVQLFLNGPIPIQEARTENERPKKVGGLNRQSCSARKRLVDDMLSMNIITYLG